MIPEMLYGAATMDDLEIKQIKRGMSPVGKTMAVVLVAGAGALAFMYHKQSEAEAARWNVWSEAQDAESREAFLTRIRADFPLTGFEDVQIAYVRKFAQYKDAASVALLIEQMPRVNNNVKGEIALAFAAIGLPGAESAKAVLLETLPQIDVAHRAQIVWALTLLREARATNEIIEEFSAGHLQQQPNFDAKAIADALGPQRLASRELTDSATASLAVRTLVAQALAETASAEAVEPLVRIATTANPNEEAELVRTAAAGLGRIGDPRVAEPLFGLLANEGLRPSLLDTLRRSVGAASLTRLLGMAQDAGVRKELVAMLRQTHDPAAADALAGELGNADADIRYEAALGLAEIADARGADVLVAFANGTDENRAQKAIEALQQLRSPKAAELVAILGDHPGRRSAVLKALGASGSATAGATLMRELAGDDIEVALVGLGALRYEPAYRRILDMAKRPRDMDFSTPTGLNEVAYRNRLKAIEALGLYANAGSVDTLFVVAGDALDDARLRVAAGKAIGLIGGDALARVVETVKSESADPVTRRALVEAFWHKPNREVASQLVALLAANTPAELRRAIAIAVGYAADPANDARLIELLSNAELKRDAAIAILLGGSDAAAAALVPLIEADRDFREGIEFALTNDSEDAFQILTPSHFESGQVLRRLRVAYVLRDGHDELHFGAPLLQFVSRLKLGWPVFSGVSPAGVRQRIYGMLTGEDAETREFAANVLGDMNERGLLIRARDANGVGASEARAKLRELNTGASRQ